MNAELAARITAARAVLADWNRALREARLSQPPGREWMFRLADALGDLLAGLDTAQAEPEPGRLTAIRGVLDAFDWEHDDRQYALEAIERIVAGDDQ
jgi:hypothetical protein